jgi:hypothetical protein
MRRAAIAVLLACVAGPDAGAQAAPRQADSLIRRGMLERAESVYYAEARRRPRDPNARANLGRYLMARGAVKIGVTLLEEALQFGGDPQSLSRDLMIGYSYLNDFQGVSRLPVSAMTAGEKQRNAWLVSHPTMRVAADSILSIAFAKSADEGALGVTPVRLDGVIVRATIVPRVWCGVRVSDTSRAAARLHAFGERGTGRTRVAVADSAGFGRMTIRNMPLEVGQLGKAVEAEICVGALMPFAPTFDSRAGLITLRMSGSLPRPSATSTVLPFYAGDARLSVVKAGGLADLLAPELRRTVLDSRWTLDTKRGQVVVEAQRP